MQRRRKQKLPAACEAIIENCSHDGRGIARVEGKTVFIEAALPGETVVFEYTRQKKDFDEGRVVAISQKAASRVEPACPHYTLCGGCSLQHMHATDQILQKESILKDLMIRIGQTEPESWLPPLVAASWHYRNKARLSVRYVEKKASTLVGFREKNNGRFITEINQCPVLHAKVDKDIPALRALIDSFDDHHCIAQIEVAAGDEEVALIFRNMTDLSEQDADKLREFAKTYQYKIFLQPGDYQSVKAFYPPEESFLGYSLPQQAINFQFHPTDFTQINAPINRLMVTKALSLLDLQAEDVVLDLFCGLGNFSLPMARLCKKVVGVEGSATMVERANMNAMNNQLTNTEFYSANLDDPLTFARFSHHQYSKMLIDPPRSGALEIVKNMEKFNPEVLLYIACNPVTLARDTAVLVQEKGYRLISAGVMDMFPHTQHVESMALFYR